MPRFNYAAYDINGDFVNGEISADTDLAALAQLSGKGLTPTSLKAGLATVPWWQRDISISGNRTAKPASLEQFSRVFSGLLNVRLTLLQALRFCANNATDPVMGRVLLQVEEDVANGATLSLAMTSSPGFFPSRIIRLIEVGEAADNLGVVCERIANTLTSESARRNEVRSALVYPMILMLAAASVLGIIVFFLAPTLAPVFSSAETELPFALSVSLSVREIILDRWPIVLVILGLLTFGTLLLRDMISPYAERIWLRAPLIGSFLRKSETLRVLEALGLMVQSGGTLIRAVSIAAGMARYTVYKELLANAHEQMTAGARLTDVLSNSSLVDPKVTMMLRAGEESDRLGPVLDHLVVDLQMEVTRSMTQAIKLVTPVVTFLIGVSVGGILLSTVTAIMSLNDVIL